MTLALPARAKLNLELEVQSRNPDGYHEVRTLLQAVALHDLVELSLGGQTALEVSGLATPAGADNLVMRALSALEEAAGRELPTRIRLVKRIPPGSGLGGASSDAATTLRGLAALHRVQVDLAPIAAGLGADVPFFLAGGAARGEGRGDRLLPVESEPAWFALAWPGIELSTAAVYRAWDECGGEPPNHLRRAAGQVAPALEEFARSLGGGWQMTGSGSAFFRRCAGRDEAETAIAPLTCWTAATHSVGRWA